MPEGDVIHRAAARIGAVLDQRVPDRIATPQRRHAAERWPQRLAGRAVCSVDAHGKHLFLRFEGDLVLHSHLRMTGAWGIHGRGERWRRAPRRAWLVLGAPGHDVVQFDGPVLELLTASRARLEQARLGPDILGPVLDQQEIVRRLRDDDPTRGIGDALIDQRNVAGIGTIWRAESCFAAAVDPWRPLARTSDAEAIAILQAARELMAASVEDPLRARAVYRREGRPCPRCGELVRGAGQGDENRASYWCPGCQR